MDAIHSTWSKPRIYSCGSFFIEDFDILTTILSALKWRELNGSIKMVTDKAGLDFYTSRGMTAVWDEISTGLDEIPHSIDPEVFWAAGKIFSLAQGTAPAAVIDTDFIVWQRLAFDALGDITVIHREDISPNIYPGTEAFIMKDGYAFDPELDLSERPANAAFYVIKNESLKREYTHSAIEFMENTAGGDRLIYMVFAEQRLLAMTAKKQNIRLNEFSNIGRLFQNGDRAFTHIWGMKQQMRDDPRLRREFCGRCIKRIISGFPEYEDMLRKIPELKAYLC